MGALAVLNFKRHDLPASIDRMGFSTLRYHDLKDSTRIRNMGILLITRVE